MYVVYEIHFMCTLYRKSINLQLGTCGGQRYRNEYEIIWGIGWPNLRSWTINKNHGANITQQSWDSMGFEGEIMVFLMVHNG